MKSIHDSIKQQLHVNQSKNLLYENVEEIIAIEPSFLAALEELLASHTRNQLADINTEIVSFTAKELVKRLHSINPYLEINRQQVEKLEAIYSRTWQVMIKTRNVKTTLSEFHYPELSKWLALLYPEAFRQSLKSAPILGNVIYGEYSAGLQVELLGIDLSRIKQPVLDVGCGRQANLVRHLRSLGIEAYGIDRHLDIHEPYLEQRDWFAYEFQPGKWGTILSNMAFTNHLNYAYLHDISQLERYLFTMRKILDSLSVGGAFHYAPSLPFVEDQLSANLYTVEREQTHGNVFVSRVTRTPYTEQ